MAPFFRGINQDADIWALWRPSIRAKPEGLSMLYDIAIDDKWLTINAQ